MSGILVADIIAKKRDAKALTEEEVRGFIEGVVSGKITAAQIGAMLMAIYLNGMNELETSILTSTMHRSGEVLEWGTEWRGTLVDKHSTGGVGEKTSLILAPAIAACGLRVPMISGRGLEHTGGTIDKLEAIPGLKTDFSPSEMHDILDKAGVFIVSPTKKMVPADKVLYGLRDVTCTVANNSLITGSIMAKKAAESLDALAMVITFGKAAFMKTEEDARNLGKMLVRTGCSLGMKTTGILMRMDHPLGRTVGNSLEILETIQCLNGRGSSDLHNSVCTIGAQLLLSTNRVKTVAEGEERMNEVIKNGSAKKKFIDMIVAQGVERELAERLFASDEEAMKILPSSKYTTPIRAQETGYIECIEALMCAQLAHQLGAGRKQAGDDINAAVGLILLRDVGDHIAEGEPWAEVHHDQPLREEQMEFINSALKISSQQPKRGDLTRITSLLY